MLTKEEILRTIMENKHKLREYGAKNLGLFGSYITNEAGKKGDIDILVELDRKTFDNYMDLKFFLEDLFKQKVDLVLTDAIKPRLKPHILKEAVYAEGL